MRNTNKTNFQLFLYSQACNLPDFSNPVSVKNHNEVLRCFSVLSKYTRLLIMVQKFVLKVGMTGTQHKSFRKTN